MGDAVAIGELGDGAVGLVADVVSDAVYSFRLSFFSKRRSRNLASSNEIKADAKRITQTGQRIN
jgi:hypothetical protein